jgi:hypothetical protein
MFTVVAPADYPGRMARGNIGSIGMRNFYKCHAFFETVSSLSGD